MGLVLALSAILISAVTFLVSWFSDIKQSTASYLGYFILLGVVSLLLIPFFALCPKKQTYDK